MAPRTHVRVTLEVVEVGVGVRQAEPWHLLTSQYISGSVRDPVCEGLRWTVTEEDPRAPLASTHTHKEWVDSWAQLLLRWKVVVNWLLEGSK